ncbi:MAG: hypothetical protein RIC06_03350 [Cyclobacteriaceae bacterium]
MLILSVKAIYGQKGDFIATDSTLKLGIKLIEGTAINNAQFVRLQKGHKEVKYYPDQLAQYGFKNGTVYESRSISVSGQTKSVFLERLIQGKLNLYYYTEKGIKTYFLERDSTLFVEVKEDADFNEKISYYTSDFNWKINQTRLVRYSRKSLSKFVSLYNKGLNMPLPFPRFGIVTGYNRTHLLVPSKTSTVQLNGISFSPSSSVSFGVFADLPIEMSYFSIHSEANFSKSGFAVNSQSPQSDIDVIVNTASVNIPLLVRYTLTTLFWRPYINAGLVYSYQVKYDSHIYESTEEQNVVTINEIHRDPLISRNRYGYSMGVGLQKNLDFRKIFAIELRHNELSGKANTLNQKQTSILISLSF